MKKILLSLLTTLTAFSLVALPSSKVTVAEGDKSISYEADFSSGIPSSWKKYDKGTTTATVSTNGGVLDINNTSDGPGENKYYGNVYLINVAEEGIGDFTLEMTASFGTYKDSGRWFGLVYHTQFNAQNMMSGYMMNYRMQGRSAQSTITSTPKFNDAFDKSSLPVLTDKQPHTFKITCVGETVTHYIDGRSIISYDFTKEAEISTQLTGQFALIVNSLEIKISSFKVSGTKGSGVAGAIEEDTNMVSVTKPSNAKSFSPFAINALLNSTTELEKLAQSKTPPVNAIVRINNKMNLIDKNGAELGVSLLDAYTNYIKGKSILNVYLDDETATTDLVKYLKENMYILDMVIVSSKASIVGEVRKGLPHIRGAVDYSSKEIKEKKDLIDIIGESTAAWANTVILSKKDSTFDNVYYIQGRFKTVWSFASEDSFDMFEVIDLAKKGVYGVITPFFEQGSKVYDALYDRNAGKNTVLRKPYNVAHRGINSNYENSLEGCIDAIENHGATHIEIDGQVTKDGHIAINHDDNLSRVTANDAGSKTVGQLTVDELRQYKIKVSQDGKLLGDGVNIPLLEEFFEYFKDKDMCILLEIKTTDTRIVTILKDLMDKYNFYGSLVCISFYPSQLDLIRTTLPNVPIALLNQGEEWQDANLMANVRQLTSSNFTFSMNYSTNLSHTDDYIYNMSIRGFASWYWTAGAAQAEFNYYKGKVVGITGNYCSAISVLPFQIANDYKYIGVDSTNYKDVLLPLDYYDYGGVRHTLEDAVMASPLYIEEGEGFADVIFGGQVIEKIEDPVSLVSMSSTLMIYSGKIRLIPNFYTYDDISFILTKQLGEVGEDDKAKLGYYLSSCLALYEEDFNQSQYEEVGAFLKAVNEYVPPVVSSSSEEIIISSSEEIIPSFVSESSVETISSETTISSSIDEPKGDKSSGCGGSIAALGGVFFLSLAGLIILRSKKED